MRLSLLRLAAAGATAAAMAPTTPALAADAVFGGTTRAGDPIVIKADTKLKRVGSAVISWDAKCSGGSHLMDSASLEPTNPVAGFSPGPHDLLTSRNGKGRFAGTQLYSFAGTDFVAAVQVELSGKLGAARASGTLSAVVKLVDRATGNALGSCDTGKLTWAASRAPGIVYGGATSQDQPVVVRLNAKRRVVADLMTAWDTSTCAPQTAYRFTEILQNFGLKSSGRFGDAFPYEVTLDAGGKRRFDYSLAGRVTKTSANGTLQVKLSDTDAAGATALACDTGRVTWKATTG